MPAVTNYPRPDFATFEARLGGCRSESDPAELHGSLCSLICIYGPAAADIWYGQSLAGADADSRYLAECSDYMSQIFMYTHNALDAAELDFALLLPDEYAPVADRTRSMALWAAGFLHGLGTGADVPELRERLAQDPLQEIVQDMVAISQASDADSTDAEDSEQTEEAAEVALLELYEYLRVALQLSYEELTVIRATAPLSTNVLH